MPNPELAGFLYLAGFAFILIGIIILVMNVLFHQKEARRGEIGGVILIGPFPIVFGTSSRMRKIMLTIGFAFVAIVLLTTFLPHLIQGM